MNYVNEESSRFASEVESRIASVHKLAGLLFVGVRCLPTENGKCDTLSIKAGIEKPLDSATGLAIIKKLLQKEIENGWKIEIEVWSGIRGGANVR